MEATFKPNAMFGVRACDILTVCACECDAMDDQANPLTLE